MCLRIQVNTTVDKIRFLFMYLLIYIQLVGVKFTQ